MRHPNSILLSSSLKNGLTAICFSVRKRVFVKHVPFSDIINMRYVMVRKRVMKSGQNPMNGFGLI